MEMLRISKLTDYAILMMVELTRDGEMQPFRSGVEKIVERTPVPVIPIALRGLCGSVFSRMMRRRIQASFHKEVPWSACAMSLITSVDMD